MAEMKVLPTPPLPLVTAIVCARWPLACGLGRAEELVGGVMPRTSFKVLELGRAEQHPLLFGTNLDHWSVF